MIKAIFRTSALLAIALAPSLVDAQAYPSKPVKVVIPSSPGGATDIQARMFSAKLSQALNQSFVVENRAGAGGRIATALVAHQSPRDGYTLLATSLGFTIVPAVDEKPQVDPLKDFEPVILMSKAPYALVVTPSLPVRTMKEFLAYAKANPGKINFALSQVGGATQLGQVWLEDATGIRMTIVPYKGVGPAYQDLIAGRIHAAFANVISAGPQISAGKMRALAVTTAERSSGMPDLPTFAESGIKDYEISPWHGWLAPKSTPRNAVNTLNAELNKVLKQPDVIKVISEDGGMPAGGTPEAFVKHIASEVGRWKRLVEIGGIKPGDD